MMNGTEKNRGMEIKKEGDRYLEMLKTLAGKLDPNSSETKYIHDAIGVIDKISDLAEKITTSTDELEQMRLISEFVSLREQLHKDVIGRITNLGMSDTMIRRTELGKSQSCIPNFESTFGVPFPFIAMTDEGPGHIDSLISTFFKNMSENMKSESIITEYLEYKKDTTEDPFFSLNSIDERLGLIIIPEAKDIRQILWAFQDKYKSESDFVYSIIDVMLEEQEMHLHSFIVKELYKSKYRLTIAKNYIEIMGERFNKNIPVVKEKLEALLEAAKKSKICIQIIE